MSNWKNWIFEEILLPLLIILVMMIVAGGISVFLFGRP